MRPGPDPCAAPCAASVLLTGMLDGSFAAPLELVEVARTSAGAHYATGRDDVPVVCLATGDAVRLPASVLVATLPAGPVRVVDGRITDATRTWLVCRWWQPPRPRGLVPPAVPPRVPAADVPAELVPHDLVGLGPGLTPTGDDVVAGALVAAHATGHPELTAWQGRTRAALLVRRTTAVSRGLLHHALDGYAVPELAAFLVAVCTDGDVTTASERLLAVGHSSGAALAAGALHAIGTHPVVRRAAA